MTNDGDSNEALPTPSEGAGVPPVPETQAEAATAVPTLASHRQIFGLRREVSMPVSVVVGCACVALAATLWWVTTRGQGEERILGHNQLPSIPETIERFPEVLDPESPERHIWENTVVSLKRVLIGFAMAAFIGVPVGIACGCFPLARSFFAPLVLFGRNIPIAALLPLVLALFGTGESQKYMFIFIACVAFVVADTIDAVNEVAQRYVETALTLGASRLQIVFKVLVPLAMPMVFSSLRVLFGLAFGYIMLVEFMHEGDGAGGLGFLLNIARRRSVTEYTVIIILTIPLVAYLIDQVLFVTQCWLFRWKYGEDAERSGAYRLSRSVLRLFWRPQARV